MQQLAGWSFEDDMHNMQATIGLLHHCTYSQPPLPVPCSRCRYQAITGLVPAAVTTQSAAALAPSLQPHPLQGNLGVWKDEVQGPNLEDSNSQALVVGRREACKLHLCYENAPAATAVPVPVCSACHKQHCSKKNAHSACKVGD
jgi:hypothetical protein